MAQLAGDEFAKLVEQSCRERSPRIIHNASFDHARILIRCLLQLAGRDKAKVKLVSGSLRPEFYGELVGALRTSMDQGAQVEAIVLDAKAPLGSNQFAETIRERGKLLVNRGNISPSELPHFIVVGPDAFRMENDQEQAKAIASFNNAEIGQVLVQFFDRLSEASFLKPLSAT